MANEYHEFPAKPVKQLPGTVGRTSAVPGGRPGIDPKKPDEHLCLTEKEN